MNRKRIRLLLLLGTLTLFVTHSFAANRISFTVLVNPKATQNLSRVEFVRVLRGDMRFWSNGRPIRIILPPRSSDGPFERVLRKLLNVDLRGYQQSWDARRFRGETTVLPMVAPDEQMTIRAVITDPSFLAIIESDHLANIPPAMRSALQVMTIDGRGPEAEGYVLATQSAD